MQTEKKILSKNWAKAGKHSAIGQRTKKIDVIYCLFCKNTNSLEKNKKFFIIFIGQEKVLSLQGNKKTIDD